MTDRKEGATGGWASIPGDELMMCPPMGYILPTAMAQELRVQVARAAVVQEACSWLGTPHRHEARVKGAGVDCGTYLLEVYERAGVIAHTDVEHLPFDFHLHSREEVYLAHVEKWAHRIEGAPEPGDLVLYRIGKCISHGAIVVSWPTIIHAHVGKGVIFDDAVANAYLAAHQVGCWRINGW